MAALFFFSPLKTRTSFSFLVRPSVRPFPIYQKKKTDTFGWSQFVTVSVFDDGYASQWLVIGNGLGHMNSSHRLVWRILYSSFLTLFMSIIQDEVEVGTMIGIDQTIKVDRVGVEEAVEEAQPILPPATTIDNSSITDAADTATINQTGRPLSSFCPIYFRLSRIAKRRAEMCSLLILFVRREPSPRRKILSKD